MQYLKLEFMGLCEECEGRGKKMIVIDGHKVLLITADNLDNKIMAIKEVRTQFPILGVKEAKELVELSASYITNMHHSMSTLSRIIDLG